MSEKKEEGAGENTENTPNTPFTDPPRPPPAGYVVTGEGLRAVGDPRIAVEGVPPSTQVFVAGVYLKRSGWIPSKTATQGSYWLKHEVERHAFADRDFYCCNGALILAALTLGIRVEPDRSGREVINAHIFIRRPPSFSGHRCEVLGCWGQR